MYCVTSQRSLSFTYGSIYQPTRTPPVRSVIITGDAAHATMPWQGSGGGMSVEDSFVLSSLLGHAETTKDAVKALKAYV